MALYIDFIHVLRKNESLIKLNSATDDVYIYILIDYDISFVRFGADC